MSDSTLTQFGVNFPSASGADLSSPSLFPELLRSRIFSEKILAKNFYTDNHRKQLSLLAILTGKNSSDIGSDTLITSAIPLLNNMIDFDQDVYIKLYCCLLYKLRLFC